MLGLFGTLNLGARSLQTQQAGVEVTGQNLANVNNPAYARQRVRIETSLTIPSPIGPQGTGADVMAIEQLRNALVDGQILSEQSVGGFWNARQSALQNVQAGLGQFLDRNADAVAGSGNLSGVSQGLADEITSLFNAFQDVATAPASLPERQALITKAQDLASGFNLVAERMATLNSGLDKALTTDVASANALLSDVAFLNDQIARSEVSTGGIANDLRDLRIQKLEELSKLVKFDITAGTDGSVGISVDGVDLVTSNRVVDTLQVYTDPAGLSMVRTSMSQTPLNPTGGSIAGTIDARDGALTQLRTRIDALASALITEVNTIHATGYALDGSTGNDFFTGNSAATIGINAALRDDPSLVQASGSATALGDNSVALELARLATGPVASLNNQTFSVAYGSIVADLGSSLKTAGDQLTGHEAVMTMLKKQRDSISGVSIDEEMTNLMTYQRAYQASAKIVTTVDELLETVLSLKR